MEMTENHNSSESMSKRSHCYGMCRGRSNRVFWGIFFIAVGFFWLGKEAELVFIGNNEAVLAACVRSGRYLVYCSSINK